MLQSSAPHRNVFQVVLLLQNEQLTHTSFPSHVCFNSGFNFHCFFQDHVSNYALASPSMVVFLTLTIVPLIYSLKQQIFIEPHCILSTSLVLEERWRARRTMAFTVRGEEPTLFFSHSAVSDSATPWTVRQTPQSRDSPGMNTAVGWHFLLQGIFPVQGLIPCLMH